MNSYRYHYDNRGYAAIHLDDASTLAETQTRSDESCSKWHVVAEGDGCWAISNRYGIFFDDFYSGTSWALRCSRVSRSAGLSLNLPRLRIPVVRLIHNHYESLWIILEQLEKSAGKHGINENTSHPAYSLTIMKYPETSVAQPSNGQGNRKEG